MENKFKSKLAIALLTATLATSVTPAFAIDHNGTIDNVFLRRDPKVTVKAPFAKYSVSSLFEDSYYKYITNGKTPNFDAFQSNGYYFSQKEYVEAINSGKYDSVSDILTEMKEMQDEEVNKFKNQLYKVVGGPGNYNLEKIETDKPDTGGENPDKPDTGGETTGKEFEELLLKLNNNNVEIAKSPYDKTLSEYNEQFEKTEQAIKKAERIQTNLDAKAFWNFIGKNKFNSQIEMANLEKNNEIDSLEKISRQFEKVKKEYHKAISVYNKDMKAARDKFNSLSNEEKEKYSAQNKHLRKLELELRIERAKHLNEDLNSDFLAEEILKATRTYKDDLSSTEQYKKASENLDDQMKIDCVETIQKLNGLGVGKLRSVHEKQINAIKRQYENFKLDLGQNFNDINFKVSIAESLFELEFVDYEVTYVTPTSEVMNRISDLRKKLKLAESLTNDFTEEFKEKYEVNGLDFQKDRAVKNRNVKLDYPEKLTSTNPLYTFFTWRLADENANKEVVFNQDYNTLSVNYTILNLIDLDFLKRDNNPDPQHKDHNENIADDEIEDEEESKGFFGNLF